MRLDSPEFFQFNVLPDLRPAKRHHGSCRAKRFENLKSLECRIAIFKFFLSQYFKVEVKSVLRICSAHNNVRINVNIAQISNVSKFSEHKLYFIFI